MTPESKCRLAHNVFLFLDPQLFTRNCAPRRTINLIFRCSNNQLITDHLKSVLFARSWSYSRGSWTMSLFVPRSLSPVRATRESRKNKETALHYSRRSKHHHPPPSSPSVAAWPTSCNVLKRKDWSGLRCLTISHALSSLWSARECEEWRDALFILTTLLNGWWWSNRKANGTFESRKTLVEMHVISSSEPFLP